MKRLLLIVLIFSACGGSEVVEEPVTTIKETTTTVKVTTTTVKTTTEPKVTILNCYDTAISNDSFELQFQIDSGSGDIVNLGIFEQKNGENHKNVFFDVEYNTNVFTFPLANTVSEYSYVIDNVGNNESSTHFVEIDVISEDGSGRDTCEIVYTPSANSSSTSSNDGSKPENPGDTKNCGDFKDYAEAKAWFDTYYPYYGDVAKLDKDGNEIPCESLSGAP